MIRIILACLIVVRMGLSLASADDKDDPHKIPLVAKTILEKGDSFELLSLDPNTPKEVPKDSFHGWRVLGKTAIAKAEQRKALVDAFGKGVSEYKGSGARCFDPRHGIRVEHDGKTADFVICFECSHVRVYVGGEREKAFLLSDSPAAEFNKVLKDAGIELAVQPKK